MTQYKIYAWGSGSQIAPFDVQSQILSRLLSEHSLNSEFAIIPNSNIFHSNSGKLPILCLPESESDEGDGGRVEQIVGFVEIWEFIQSKRLKNPDTDDIKTRMLQTAYLNDMVKNLELITMYNFFVVKKNYEGYTRGSFQNYLPWPTQYKPPVDMRKHAIELCLDEGVIDDESVGMHASLLESDMEEELQLLRREEKQLRDTPVINDMQKLQIDKQLDIIGQKKSLISNMQCVKRLKQVLEKHAELKDILASRSDFFDTILNVYLKCNIVDDLKENFIRAWLQTERVEVFQTVNALQLAIDDVNEHTSKLPLSTALQSLLSNLF